MVGEPDSAELHAWVRLSLTPEIGPRTAAQLLLHFGSPETIFECPPEALAEVEGIGPRRVEALLTLAHADAARREVERAEQLGVSIVTQAHSGFPRALRDLTSPPVLVYVQGEISAEDRLALAVVGPRAPSDYAREMARSLIPPLCARGITIVSGLAAGIDSEAHQAALDCEGRTVAVLGQGLGTRVTAAPADRLAKRIVREKRGALISIFPLDTASAPGNYPARNEIIAALSLGTLVVEAGESSGALITAGHAGELGRPILACPGDVTRANARGSNRLIAEGATLVQRSDHILNALAPALSDARKELGGGAIENEEDGASAGRSNGAVRVSPPIPADPLEARIYELLAAEHRGVDFILEGCAATGYSQSDVVQKLLILELSGSLRQLPGRIYSVVSA